MTYIWRNLLERKVRTGLSMLGVAVAVAGIIALISVAEGALQSLDEYMEDSGATLTVFSRNVADLIFSSVKMEEIDGIRGLDGVQSVSRSNFFMSKPPEGKRLPMLPVILVFGRYPEERIMERYRPLLVDGRPFQDEKEIFVAQRIAEALDWGVGRRIKLPSFDGEFEVVGTYESDIAWENAGVILHADVVARKLGRKDNYTLVFVFTDPAERDAVKERIESAYPKLVAVPAAEFTNYFKDQIQTMDDVVGMITVIALVLGVLGVLNTMMMSVAERTREIGMLRALGWSRARVVRTIFLEGVLLATVGAGLGLVLGVVGTEALTTFYPVTPRYAAATLLQGLVVGVLVGIVAAIYPAIRAASLRPVEALRYE